MARKTKKGIPAFRTASASQRNTPVAERATVRDVSAHLGSEHEYAWVPEGLRPGDLLEGKYRIEKLAGEGGMGIVLAALDEQLRRRVAVKVIRPPRANEAMVGQMFLNEARIMARVRDPHIVEIHSFGELGGTAYFVMEFVEGTNLEKWLEEQGRMLAIDEVVGIMIQLCKGVTALHAAGAVHRDLKPSNVLIGAGFRVVVADFGLSSAPVEGGQRMRVGTPGFMGPETILSDEVDPKLEHLTDIYALGVILYRMLAGHLPYDGPPLERLRKQLEEPYEALSIGRPEIPTELDEIVARCMDRHLEARMPSAKQLRTELEAMQARARTSLTGGRVLVVDDDPDCQVWLEAVLSELIPGLSLESYYWAEDAEKAAAGADLIITDLHLPGDSGAQLVSAIRSNPATKDVPIIAVSGKAGATDWRVLKQLGADAFLLKPLDEDVLEAKVRRFLREGRPKPRE